MSRVPTADPDTPRAATARLARGLLLAGALGLLALVLLFGLDPGLDLATSRLFAAPAGGFPLAQLPALQLLREVLRRGAEGVAVVSGLLALVALASPRLRARLPAWRETGFLATAYILGPGLLANLLLKEHWGRARPRDVTQFGGPAQFTSPLTPAAQCLHNCSFVSGEGTAFACLAFSFLLLLWPRTAPARRPALALGLGLALVLSAGLRVAFGAHFLSDALFAAAFMALLVPAVWFAFGLDRGAG